MNSHQLDRYSFLWSEARLLIAAVLYVICAVYLWRRWSEHGQKLFS